MFGGVDIVLVVGDYWGVVNEQVDAQVCKLTVSSSDRCQLSSIICLRVLGRNNGY